jgi:hypothetical protein
MWEYLRPAAIVLSLVITIVVEVWMVTLVTDNLATVVSIGIAVVAFLPMWFATYTVLALPVNFLIGLSWTGADDAAEEHKDD